MKYLFSLFLCITIVLVSSQSWMKQVFGSQLETPELVVNKYLAAVISNDYETAFMFVSDDNKETREWLAFLNFVTSIAPEKLISTIHLVHSLTRHQVVQIDLPNDGTTVINIESMVPDIEKTFKITHSENEIRLLYDNGSLPLKNKQGTFTLASENKRWKIRKVEGASGNSVSKIVMDLVEELLSKEESIKLDREIRNYQDRKKISNSNLGAI